MAKKFKNQFITNRITELTFPRSDRYIQEYYSDFTDGFYTISAPQGSNKTGAIVTIGKDKKVLSIGSRNELGEQTKIRCPKQIHSTHRLSSKDYINRDILQATTNLWINYSSLKKLTAYRSIQYDILIIDEPTLISQHSTTYLPNLQDEDEYIYRITSTPVVIFMGAEIPEYLKREIRYFASERHKHFPQLSNDITHYEYSNAFLTGTTFRFVQSSDERNSEIAKVLKYRMDSTDLELGKWWAKGVLIATELGPAVRRIKTYWEQWYRENYPDYTPNIVAVYAKNSDQYREYLEPLSDELQQTGIDVLIISSVWGQGLNIRHEFDLTVLDCCRNSQLPFTWQELLHLLTRDRDCKKFVIQDRNSLPEDKHNILIRGRIKSIDDLSQYHAEFGIKTDQLLIRNSDGTVKPLKKTLVNRLIESEVDTFWNRFYRDKQLRAALVNAGAIEEVNPVTINKNLPKGVKEELNQLILDCEPYTKVEADDSIKYREEARRIKYLIGKDLGRPCKSQREIDQWADGGYLDNEANRKYLDNKSWQTIKEIEKDTSELYQAVYVIRACINFLRGVGVITGAQLNLNPLWIDLLENQEKYNRLIEELRWYDCTILDEIKNSEIENLYWLEKILKRFNYHVQLNRSGVKQTVDPKTNKTIHLATAAQKEHSVDFKNWKRMYRAKNSVIGYLKYKDYLWQGLNDGSLIYSKLGKVTRKYIQSFDHLIIKDYPTRIGGTRHV